MTKLKVKTGHWVVVCDGRKALILENAGDEKFINLRPKEVREHPDAPTREQGASPPGRSFQSVGRARSAVEQTDWHDEAERGFLRALVERLNAAVEAGETEAVTMIASPRALGMIRPVYSTVLRQKIVQEVPKDLVNRTTDEIERAIQDL